MFEEYITKYWNIGEQSDATVICGIIDEIIKNNSILPKDITVLSNYIHILRDIEATSRNQCKTQSVLTFETKEQFGQLMNDNEHLEENLRDIRRVAKVHFTTVSDGIKYSSIQSFKGWESNTVIFIIPTLTIKDNIYCVTPQDNTNALIYTAITRARQNLFVINLGNSQYDGFFKRLM